MPSLARKIAEGTFIISLSKVGITLFGFFATLILIRNLGVHDFGLFTLVLSGFTIAGIFLDLGLSNVLIADVANELGNKRPDRAKTLLYRYSQMEVLAGLSLFGVVFLSIGLVEARHGDVVGGLVKIGALLLIAWSFRNVFMVTFSSHTKFHYLSFMELLECTVRLLLVIVFVLLMEMSIKGAMLAYSISAIVSIVIAFPLFVKTLKHFQGVERAKINLFFNTVKGHGKYVMLMYPFNTLSKNLPFWIIQPILGLEAVGYYSAAKKVQNVVVLTLSSLETVLMPIISEEFVKSREKALDIIHRSVKYSLILSSVLFSLFTIFARPLFETFFTSSYLLSVPVFRILLLTLFISSFTLAIKPLFFTLKLQKYLFVVYLLNLPLLVLGGAAMTSKFGIVGMAIAAELSLFLSLLLMYYYLSGASPIKIEFRDIFKVDDYDRKLISRIMNSALPKR